MQEYNSVQQLVDLLDSLRDEKNGCPWDLAQDFKSLTPYTIEEIYELIEAIENGNPEDIENELGDLFFHLVFYAKLGKEKGWFNLESIAQTITNKMISRHPHVFERDDSVTESARDKESTNEKNNEFKEENIKELEEKWYKQKSAESENKDLNKNNSWMDSVSKALPAFVRAKKIQKQAARIGFDFSDRQAALNKLKEEIAELEELISQPTEIHNEVMDKESDISSRIADEFGDVLFSCVNLARHLGCDSETALRLSSHKFSQRFKKLESLNGYDHEAMKKKSLSDLEIQWGEIKTSM